MGKALLAMLLLFASVAAPARGQRPSHYHSGMHGHSRSRSYSTHEAYPHRAHSHSCRGHHVRSSATSHSHRSVAAKDAFKREQPCPSTGRSSALALGM
jgi:Ni/Co efflux regulator RcnB